MVDDFSSDSSRDIIEKYSNKYPNVISVYSDKNHGFPGYGRNVGIQKSSSKYIMFLDNDDEYSKDYCEVMFNTIESENVDIVCSNHIIKYQRECVKKDTMKSVSKEVNLDGDSFLVDLSEIHYVYGSEIWTKIFKSQIIKDNKIEFVEDCLNEDTLFLLNYYLYAQNLFFIDYYGYVWYENDDHLSSHSVKSASLFIDSYYKQLDFLLKNYENIDVNHEFQYAIEGTIASTVLASKDKQDRLFLIKKLYDFEKYIEFDGKLPHIWGEIVNYFILRRKCRIVLLIMSILNIGVNILFFIKKMKTSLKAKFN